MAASQNIPTTISSYCVAHVGDHYAITDGVGSESTFLVRAVSLELVESAGGTVVAHMKANLAATKFEVTAASGESLGALEFAWLTLKKGYAMHVGDRAYHVDKKRILGPNEFALTDESGAVTLTMYDLGDKRVLVLSRGAIPTAFAIYGAVALLERRDL